MIEILRIPSKQKESEAESGIKETTLVDRTRHVIIEPLDTLKMYNNMECSFEETSKTFYIIFS